MSAWVFERVVVQRFTCWNAWKVHLCTRVWGHTARRAFSKPELSSDTNTSGGAMRDISAAQASDRSLLARCHTMMWESVQVIRGTRA